jgi:hypothetical protein
MHVTVYIIDESIGVNFNSCAKLAVNLRVNDVNSGIGHYVSSLSER